MVDIPENTPNEDEDLQNSEQYPIPLERDDFQDDHGVLLSDKIKHYVDNHRIIEPFDEGCLEPAGYKMRIGDHYYRGVIKEDLADGDHLIIDPYEVVVIETAERVCIPRFMIARWNIKVKLAYKGLLWVGAAQVDPGYVGHLSCPIYNLSTRPVKLRKGEALALIDFVNTTKYDDSTCKKFPLPLPRGIDNVALEGGGLESALLKHVDRVKEVEKTANEVKTQSTYFSTVVITLLGVLFAVLGSSMIAEMPKLGWGKSIGIIAIALSLSLSLSALLLSLGSGYISLAGAIWKDKALRKALRDRASKHGSLASAICKYVLVLLAPLIIVFLLGLWLGSV